MKIDIHISDITPQEMQKLATWLNDGRRFQLSTNADSGDDATNIISVSNNPRKKTSARPVVGQKGTRIEQWPSVTACAEALEVAVSTVQRAIKNRTNMNTGWRLWYKANPMPEATEPAAEPAGVSAPATVADIPDDPDAPEWSRQPVRIKGIAGKEVRHWQSIYQCCREIGANYGQVRHAYKHYGKVNGWMLMTDDEEKLGSA